LRRGMGNPQGGTMRKFGIKSEFGIISEFGWA
jgi:hypothetical protein